MSDIFKIFYIDDKNIKKVYIFKGSNEDEVFSKSEQKEIVEKGIEIVNVEEMIYKDDTIKRIKEKVFLHCNLNVSTSEIFLMGCVTKLNKPSIIYNRLTQDNKISLTSGRISTFLSNIITEEHPIRKKTISIEEKENYEYNDLLNLEQVNWTQLLKTLIPIGQKVVMEKIYDFTVNPFHSEIDDFLLKETENFISMQNRNLLFEYGNLNNNILYLCTCEDVLIHGEKTGISQEYLLKLYFPELYLINDITDLQSLIEKRNEIIQKDVNFIKKNNIQNYNENINLLYNLYNKQNRELEYLNSGINKILLTIHPTTKINLPLEILFKIIHSSELIPLVKYNPGTRQENIYRLFTDDNLSKNGKKIPTLYVNDGYKKGKIMRLLANIEKKKRVTYIVVLNKLDNKINIYYNFLENGNIEVSINFGENNYQKLDFIESIIKETLNKPILSKINNFLEQSGYSYIKNLNSLKDDNIEIMNINYFINIKNNKKINFKSISKCINCVFNYQESIKDSNTKYLKYKRVSNFELMDSIESFITVQRQMGKSMETIVENVMLNFSLNKGDAESRLSEWAEKVAHTLALHENTKAKVISSPGFNIILKNTKMLLDGSFQSITIFEVQNITNIKYIYHIDIFIDSLMRLAIDKNSSSVDTSLINKLCKRGQVKEIEESKDIRAVYERPLEDMINNVDQVRLNETIDSIVGMEEELSSSSEDEEEYDEIENIPVDELIQEPKPVEKKDENIVMETDLSKFSISGNNNIFLKRLRAHDKKLFIIDQKKGFQSYSKACPWQYKRYPVVLTEKDKKYIDTKDAELGVKSYDEHITYGSTEKKHHYICPRFWCFRDEKGKQRSLSFEQVNSGECGGWDAVIPSNAKKIKKGKRIFEFTDTRMHKEGVDTDNKLVYRPFYPGYQARNKHPEGLCVPCCFKAPTKTLDKEGNEWIKEGKKFINQKTKKESKTAPKYEYDYMFQPTPLPKYETKDGKIVLDTIQGKKWNRPIGKRSQIKNWKDCDEGNVMANEEKEEEEEGIANIPLLDIFPLKKNKLGYLTIALQKFLGFDCKSICQKSITDTRLKENVWCLMRMGIEKSMNQSFLALIAYIYNFKNSKKLNIKSIKKEIIKKLTKETFMKLQNGNLIEIFNINTTNKVDNSFENFKKYINSTNELINHEYLWDFISLPERHGGFFDTGLNLVILESPDDDITHKINLLCPTNIYSSEIFSLSKPTVIIYTNNNYYEPVIRYKINRGRKDVNLLFNFKTLNVDAPEVVSIMRIIKEKMLTNCNPLKSMPNKYNKELKFTSNISSYRIKKIIEEEELEISIKKQVVNRNMKVIALIVNTNMGEVYLPCYPSGINILIPTVSLNESEEIMKKYEKTVEILKTIYNSSNKKIQSNPKYKVINENMIVGIITITNQFIPTIPEPYISSPIGMKGEKDGLEVFDSNTKYYEDYISNEGGEIVESNERSKIVKKIKLESNFYNIFRNTLRIVLNSRKNEKQKLKRIIEDKRIKYNDKLKLGKTIIENIMESHIDFVNYDDIIDNINDINEIIKCFGIINKKDCNEKKCCAFSEPSGLCQLLLPEKNLINGIDNDVYYFVKIIDEMIRFKKINNFFFDKDVFLYFNKVNYNLNKNEIILLENLLLSKYFVDIVPLVKSKYIKTNKLYDIVNPEKSVAYSNKYNIGESNMIVNKCLLYPGEEGPNLPEGTQWREVGLGRWNEHSKFTLYRVKESQNCLWEFLILLIKDYTKNELTKGDLVTILVNFYREKIREGLLGDIKEILKVEGKKNIVEQFKEGINIELIINFQNYYITLLDIFIIAKHFNLPIIIFSSTLIKDFYQKSKILVHDKNSSEYYLIKIAKSTVKNKAPIFGIFSYKNRLKIKPSELSIKKDKDGQTAKTKLFKNGGVKTFENYNKFFKIVQKRKKNKKN